VEFVLSVEDAFGIAIPNADAEHLTTPRILADYVERRLPQGSGAVCRTQRAFYLLRSGVVQAHRVPRDRIRPETTWGDLLPRRHFGKAWRHMKAVVGTSEWPLQSFLGFHPARGRTVRSTAEYLAVRAPAALKHRYEGWTRSEIEAVITGLMSEDLGIAEFRWDDRFVEELRVD
jgi:hypothetical protein